MKPGTVGRAPPLLRATVTVARPRAVQIAGLDPPLSWSYELLLSSCRSEWRGVARRAAPSASSRSSDRFQAANPMDYRFLDNAITRSYQSAALEERQQALSQAFAIVKANGSFSPSRASVIAAAHAARPAVEPFDKDGYLWVGRLGLRFIQAGQLVEAAAARSGRSRVSAFGRATPQ